MAGPLRAFGSGTRGDHHDVGSNRRYGLEKPDHELFAKDVTVNTSLMYALMHGTVRPRKEIARFDGHTVHFVDGGEEDYDTVVWATGFRTRFPFLDGVRGVGRQVTRLPKPFVAGSRPSLLQAVNVTVGREVATSRVAGISRRRPPV